MPSRHRLLLVLLPLLALLAGRLDARPSPPPRLDSALLPVTAGQQRLGERLRLDGVELPATSESLTLALERFAVFAADAEIVVHGDAGPRRLPVPATAFFRGEIEGEPGSRAFLAVLAGGRVQGLLSRPGDHLYLIDNGAGDDLGVARRGRLQGERADAPLLATGKAAPWQCAAEALEPPSLPLGLDLAAPAATSAGGGPVASTAAVVANTARIAIETDHELYTRFPSADHATNYIGSLIGYASTIYEREISTSLVVQSVSLWATSADPWTQTGTTCGLMEFGRYWNRNRSGVSRTIAHFLSGKANGGGVAWLGVLCSGPFHANASCPGLPTDAPWGGGYGYTGNIIGNFNPANPTVVWDILAVTHEIGHNFSSPHTHCYSGIGGVASPVDYCRSDASSGCYNGPQSLPGLGTAGGGSSGNGNGTIMSYCHLIGGYSSMSLTFGQSHPYGVQPQRVSTRMRNYVASFGNASCLAPAAGAAIFADGFEQGLVPPWSQVSQ